MKNKELIKYIVAFTIGDGYLSNLKTINSNSYYKCSLKYKHFDLLEFQMNIFDKFCEYKTYSELRNKCTILRTKTNFLFTKVRRRLYDSNNNRIIDPHLIKYIDEEVLSLLYMFDGSLIKYKRKNNKQYIVLKLSTHSYSYYDNLALSNYIRENFNINFKVQREYDKRYNKHYNYLLCRQNEAIKFLKITKPYMLKSFNYKWDVEITKGLLRDK